ncbi:hypothetical protein [Thiolapillus sp.]|uniref:hypothetical protein n=1 Tax=Thiolapillus sp. TaxID=2017437 RepID=UPI003AF6DC26
MTIKIALISEKNSSVEEAQTKNLSAIKDKHLKEKRTLPERLMMNDSRNARRTTEPEAQAQSTTKKRNNYQENYEVLRRREPIRRKKVKTIKLNP